MKNSVIKMKPQILRFQKLLNYMIKNENFEILNNTNEKSKNLTIR